MNFFQAKRDICVYILGWIGIKFDPEANSLNYFSDGSPVSTEVADVISGNWSGSSVTICFILWGDMHQAPGCNSARRFICQL